MFAGMCVCVCVWEREREREREFACLMAWNIYYNILLLFIKKHLEMVTAIHMTFNPRNWWILLP